MILSIESATKNCSVSLHNQGELMVSKELQEDKFSHSEHLHVFIKELMTMAGVSFKELDAVAVSKGPGSYTGLRIGVSAAKGICFSVDCPLIGIDTLEVLAKKGVHDNPESGIIIPVIDARRDEVYTAVYTPDMDCLRKTNALILDDSSYSEYSDSSRLFIGDAVNKMEQFMSISPNDILIHTYPSSKELGFLAWDRYQKKEFVDVAYFEPYYLKDFKVTPSKKKI